MDAWEDWEDVATKDLEGHIKKASDAESEKLLKQQHESDLKKFISPGNVSTISTETANLVAPHLIQKRILKKPTTTPTTTADKSSVSAISAPNTRKILTLAERELEYKLARERIMGPEPTTNSNLPPTVEKNNISPEVNVKNIIRAPKGPENGAKGFSMARTNS